MSHAVAQYPLDFYRSSIVSKPLLVPSKDKSRVFIRLADEIQAGLHRPSSLKRNIGLGAQIVNSARAEFTPHHLRKLVSERNDKIPAEILAQLQDLLSGKHPRVLSATEARPIVLSWRAWGNAEAKWAAGLEALNIPWAMTISLPPFRFKYLDSEIVNEAASSDFCFERAATLPGDLADLLHLRGRSGRLAFPGENEMVTLQGAIRRLWTSKLWGQSCAMGNSVAQASRKRRCALVSSARLMVPHFVALSALMEGVEDLHDLPLRFHPEVQAIIDEISLAHCVMMNHWGNLNSFHNFRKAAGMRSAVQSPGQRRYSKVNQEFRQSA